MQERETTEGAKEASMLEKLACVECMRRSKLCNTTRREEKAGIADEEDKMMKEKEKKGGQAVFLHALSFGGQTVHRCQHQVRFSGYFFLHNHRVGFVGPEGYHHQKI
jgi:hypothetical protein